jgi:hypothetical protein
MKKNWKCIIGATLLAPVVLTVLVAVTVGLIFLVHTFPIVFGLTLFIAGLLVILIMIWSCLYDHCVKKKH